MRIALNNQIVYVCTLCPLGEYEMLAKKVRERPCQTGREKSWGAFHCVCILQLLLLVHRFQVGHAKMLHSWLLATKKWLNLSPAEGAFSLNPVKTLKSLGMISPIWASAMKWNPDYPATVTKLQHHNCHSGKYDQSSCILYTICFNAWVRVWKHEKSSELQYSLFHSHGCSTAAVYNVTAIYEILFASCC